VPVEGGQTALRIALAHRGVAKRITPHALRHYADIGISGTPSSAA